MSYFAETDSATLFRLAFNPEDRQRLPYYSALADRLAESETACHLLTQVRATQRNPMLVFAALHYHALAGHPELSPLYANLRDWVPADWASTVIAVLEKNPSLIAGELRRSTQTNEPNRTAALAAVLGRIKHHGIRDIHLIDVGSSMGFNLYPDYAEIVVDQATTNAGQLVTSSRGGSTLSFDTPTIHQRIGIDLNPLDPTNPDDVLWIRACLWPEQEERSRRCEEILRRMRQWPFSERRHGDANDIIESVAASLPPGPTPVVFHSWVLAYFSEADQQRWRQHVDELVRQGAIWVSFESPYATSGLSLPAPTTNDPDLGDAQLVVALPGASPEHWGWAHPHARWVQLT